MALPSSMARAAHQDMDLRLTGTWPDDITGSIVISGPGIHPGSPLALYEPGRLNRISLRPGTHGAAPDAFAWRSTRVETPSARLFSRAPEAFEPSPNGYVSALGTLNCVNTAPLPWGDRLFATWDVGRPVELDPVDHRFLGEVGDVESWGGGSMPGNPLLPMLFTTAHPVVDPDRNCLWGVKAEFASMQPFALEPQVIRYSGSGKKVDSWPMQGIETQGLFHCLTQTREWLIYCDSGHLRIDLSEVMGGERTTTIPQETPLWFIRKADLEDLAPGQPVKAVLGMNGPPCGHVYANYDDSDGVRMLFEQNGLDIAFSLREGDLGAHGKPVPTDAVGMFNLAMCRSTLTDAVFAPETGRLLHRKVQAQDWMWNQSLSAMDWSPEGQLTQDLHHIVYFGNRPDYVSQRSLQLYGERYPASDLPEQETKGRLVSYERDGLTVHSSYELPSISDYLNSPTFIPKGAETAAGSKSAGERPGGRVGYVLLAVHNDAGFRFELFNADSVGNGPIATLRPDAGQCVPAMLHSFWLPEPVAAPDVERLAFADEVADPARLADLPDALKTTVREVAEELQAEA